MDFEEECVSSNKNKGQDQVKEGDHEPNKTRKLHESKFYLEISSDRYQESLPDEKQFDHRLLDE